LEAGPTGPGGQPPTGYQPTSFTGRQTSNIERRNSNSGTTVPDATLTVHIWRDFLTKPNSGTEISNWTEHLRLPSDGDTKFLKDGHRCEQGDIPAVHMTLYDRTEYPRKEWPRILAVLNAIHSQAPHGLSRLNLERGEFGLDSGAEHQRPEHAGSAISLATWLEVQRGRIEDTVNADRSSGGSITVELMEKDRAYWILTGLPVSEPLHKKYHLLGLDIDCTWRAGPWNPHTALRGSTWRQGDPAESNTKRSSDKEDHTLLKDGV
jgi:hypothetical protein